MDNRKRFVKELFLDTEFNYSKVFKKVYGYYNNKALSKLLEDPYVKREIKRKQDKIKYSMNITEEMIIERLWIEATQGDKSSSRITALVHLGKHIGMFQEKKDDNTGNITYQIVNYGNIETPKLEAKVEKEENTEQTEAEEVEIQELDIDIKTYA